MMFSRWQHAMLAGRLRTANSRPSQRRNHAFINTTMQISSFKNLRFGITVFLSAAAGISIAIAEDSGFTHAATLFQILGLVGAIYFIIVAFVLPYQQLKFLTGGFSFTNNGEHQEVQWSDVIEIHVFKENRQLEWIISTKQHAFICIMDDEYLYRHRLRKGAADHLHGFDEAALQQAIESSDDGSWKCFTIT
ncbi:hypothetical protein JOD97_003285 [Duganella sp. 1411]|uniref:hypothetical protein n=1 Tax=Duganella sp. 1411 TaxID=2806572 RepID=UPI001AE3E397|nr:hypothetical protein [Duganella sp. 1411]MBP1205243.1 hypothetical protein [Duganella sp. 1411]